jgi:hypothetical protein
MRRSGGTSFAGISLRSVHGRTEPAEPSPSGTEFRKPNQRFANIVFADALGFLLWSTVFVFESLRLSSSSVMF